MASPEWEPMPNNYRVKISNFSAYMVVAVFNGLDNLVTTFYTPMSVWPEAKRQLEQLILLDALPTSWQPSI